MLNRFTGYKRLIALAALSGGAAPVERTATGNPLTFGTDLAKPLKSLLIPFTPVQSGSGDPSPQNIRSILPWNGLKVEHGGKNLFPMLFKSKQTGGITYTNNGDGSLTINGTAVSFEPQTVELDAPLPAGTYRLWGGNDKAVSGANAFLGVRTSDGVDKGLNLINVETSALISTNTPITKIFLNIFVGAVVDNITIRPQLEVGSVSTEYEPYKPITETDISFPSPVYGGEHEAVSGKMNVPVAFAEFDGSDDESWNVGAIDENKSRAFIALAGAPKSGYNRDIIGNYIKPTASAQSSPDLWTANINASGNILIGIDPSITTVEGWKAYLAEHPLQIVYPLATPQEITLTPEQITALKGENTIWSDADGSLTAVYLVSAAYSDSHPVGGLGSGLLGFGSGNPDPDKPGKPDDDNEQPEDDQTEEP